MPYLQRSPFECGGDVGLNARSAHSHETAVGTNPQLLRISDSSRLETAAVKEVAMRFFAIIALILALVLSAGLPVTAVAGDFVATHFDGNPMTTVVTVALDDGTTVELTTRQYSSVSRRWCR